MNELLIEATAQLHNAGVSRPRWTAEQLLSYQLGIQPIQLYLESQTPPQDRRSSFKAIVAARAGGMPLQYLMGMASFYGREFRVGPGVFIPRPETEILIDVVVDLLKRFPHHPPVVADVGTGSGAIAITLKREWPGIRMIGIDRSSLALSFAERNAREHQVDVRFVPGDLVEPLESGSVDLIVANLPYLDAGQAANWPPELAWEPWLALDGGCRGMELIGVLIKRSPKVLRPGGRVVLEIGMEQAEDVCAAAVAHSFIVEKIVQDLAGLDRTVVLRL